MKLAQTFLSDWSVFGKCYKMCMYDFWIILCELIVLKYGIRFYHCSVIISRWDISPLVTFTVVCNM